MSWGVVLWVGIALMALSIPISIVQLLQSWENRRFVHRSFRGKGSRTPFDAPHAAVVIPVKGVDLDLKRSLRSLLHQDYRSYEVHFVGEDSGDPAYTVVQELIAEGPQCAVHWHSAGQATDCGQKVHNLRVACQQLTDSVELVAFADSDVHPAADWLHALAYRLTQTDPRLGAATGYRVCVPNEPGWANWILYSINSNVGSLLSGSSPFNLIWGGSWIIRRELLEEGRLCEAWEGAISDDMVASQIIRSLGRRIGFEPRILVPSATSMTMSGLIEFLRRQFYMVRHYSPRLWKLLLAASTVLLGAFWFNAGLAIWGATTGAAFWWIPAAFVAATYLSILWRAKLRWNICRLCNPDQMDRLATARRWEWLAAPLSALLAWIGLAGSAFGRRVVWRNIRYALDRHGRVTEIEHLSANHEPRRRAA